MKATVNVRYLESVVNPEAEVLKEAVGKLGIEGVSSVALGRTYHFSFEGLNQTEVEQAVAKLADELLVNKAMETYTIDFEEA